jgi:hypothetical protein
MLMDVTFDQDSEGLLDTFNGSQIIISNDRFELLESLVKQVSQIEVGDVLSISLVNDPDEKDLESIKEHKDYELASSSSFDFDD